MSKRHPCFLSPVPLNSHRHASNSASVPRMCSQTPSTHPTRRQAIHLLAGFATSLLLPSASQAGVRVADADAGSKVITTASGLQFYDFITPSSEATQVLESSRVTVHYTLGTTGARNGWKIDSSYDREPLSFTVGKGEVVRGMEEAVVGMRVGGKRRVLIPSNLGYVSKNDKPIPPGFAEYQRFKNLYLNPNIPYKPDVVMDITIVKVR